MYITRQRFAIENRHKKKKVYSDEKIIEGCIQGKSEFQKALYDKYAGKMYALCLRYARHKLEAEDILQDGFIKVFQNIRKYRGEGSFEGWIRRIMVHEAIRNYRKSHTQNEFYGDEQLAFNEKSVDPKIIDQLSADEMMQLLEQLPDGYRLVFNLFVVEGLKHKEISEILDIGVSTSRSQLTKAKKMMQQLIQNMFSVIFF